MEETLVKEAGAHGRAGYLLTRVLGVTGIGLLLADTAQTGSDPAVFNFGVALVVLAAAVERTRD
jgi:hypothetical protein